jgi:hypothetical protein
MDQMHFLLGTIGFDFQSLDWPLFAFNAIRDRDNSLRLPPLV